MIGAGLPLLQRLKLLRAKEERIASETPGMAKVSAEVIRINIHYTLFCMCRQGAIANCSFTLGLKGLSRKLLFFAFNSICVCQLVGYILCLCILNWFKLLIYCSMLYKTCLLYT